MASSYLSKYYDDNNPVLSRLTITRKILIRVIAFIVSTFVFLILRIINKNNVFGDISTFIVWAIYIVMLISSLISLLGLVFIIISLINKEKANSILKVIPFNVKNKIFTFLDWLLVIPLCICAAIFIFGHLFRIHPVVGGSMKPTVLEGERVISIYNYNELKRGDVVIVDVNTDTFVVSTDNYWIKRIIGLPGDSLTWNQNGLILNGNPVDEEYVFRNENGTLSIGDTFNGQFEYKKTSEEMGIVIPEGYVFVMGDNRGVSEDSRVIGLVPVENVLGVVRVRFSGLGSIKTIKRGSLE